MKVLFIGAHYDDIELGCAGTIQKHLAQDDEVIYLGLSDCGNVSLTHECNNSLNILWVKHRILKTHLCRLFEEHRQSILDDLIEVKRQYSPDVVYTHSQYDRHQDHATVGIESLRAFKNSTILTYTSAHNRLCVVDNYFVSLSDELIDKKIEALKCYKSQTDKIYMSDDFIYGTAMIAGGIYGPSLAESFHAERIIV